MPILIGDALQQCDQLLNLLVGGGPAGADAHHRVRVVGLFHEAEAHAALQTFGRLVIKRDEDLVGRRVESERITAFHEHFANAVGRIVGAAGDSAVQVVGEQRVELHAQQPSLGEQSSMLLDERHEVLRHVAVREHHRFAEHGTHLGTADVEHVRDARDVFKRHVVAGCGQRVAESCAVNEQWHVVLRADLADRLEFVERVERAIFGGL